MFRITSTSLLTLAIAFVFLVPAGCSYLRPGNQSPRKVEGPSISSLHEQPSESAAADIQFAVGQSAELKGDFNGAVAAYQKVVEMDDTKFEAYHRLALLHDKRGDSPAATTLYAEALKRAPNVPEIHCDWGYNCYLLRQWSDAESHLRTAIGLRPDFERAHNNLALLLARQGRTNEALHEFARAGATESQARSNIALAMMLEGQLDPAQEQLEMAQKLPSGANRAPVAKLQKIAKIATVTTGNQMASLRLPPIR
jgi:Flp pilus assembly protein TadD